MKTLQEKLISRKLHKAGVMATSLLVNIVKVIFLKRFGVRFHYKIRLQDIKPPYFVVCNHASRLDYIYVSPAFLPYPLNYVVGYNEFFRSHLVFVLRMIQAIPKKNFVPDAYTIRQMNRVIKEGGRIVLFPEGMSSISGANQPCAISSGKLLKHFKLPVLAVKISGGYLTNTKYCLDERPGRVDVEIDKLFMPEDLAAMTNDEVQAALDAALTHDDYEWNKTARVAFDGKGRMAYNMHTLLYWCPKCGAEFSMRGEGDVIRCGKCGNGARLNEYYDLIPLDETCVIPETPRVWFDLQRENARRLVAGGDFEMKERVKLGTLPRRKLLKNQDTSEITGEGTLTLNPSGLRFEGLRDGKPFSFSIKPEQLPTYGMCTDVTRFYTFYEGEFLEFFPERETVMKWFLVTEENHRAHGGAWKNFPKK
jgi:1-acyl-sn-glycerol-3-phosphate acyltransferase/ribosomal protein S27AE